MEMEEESTAEGIKTQEMKLTSEPIKTPGELWEELSSYSTLHGFHFTYKKSSTLRRVIWILLMLGSGCFLVNQIYNSWGKVVAFRVFLKNHNEFRDTLDFPAVSICNENMMRKSRINGTLVQRYLDLLDPHKKSKLSDIGWNYSLDINSAVRQYGHNLSEMLLRGECRWPGKMCKAVNFTTFFDYMHGLCYTFNSGKNNKNILKATKVGSTFGLSFVINAQPEEYYGPYSLEGTGFRVIIHDQMEYPFMEKASLQISPGSSVEMVIKRKEFHSLPAPYPKLCKSGKGFSRSICLEKCRTRAILRTCQCKTLGMLHSTSESIDFPWCTPWQIRNCLYGVVGVRNQNKCDCQVQCYRVGYDVQSSSMYYPSQSLWESLAVQYNISSDPVTLSRYQAWFRKRYVKLSVFYGDLEAEISTEEPAYEVTDLANDLGGSMGLFLGCSVLTVCEFIDVLILMCISLWRSKRQASVTVHKTS